MGVERQEAFQVEEVCEPRSREGAPLRGGWRPPGGPHCWIQELPSPDTTWESLQGDKQESDLTGLRFRTGGRPGGGGGWGRPSDRWDVPRTCRGAAFTGHGQRSRGEEHRLRRKVGEGGV